MPRTPKTKAADAPAPKPDQETAPETPGPMDAGGGMPPPAKRTRRRGAAARRTLPLLPIRDQVYFPHMIFPLLVGREKSVRALDEAIAQDRHIVLVAQRAVNTEEPSPDDLYTVGIEAEIMQILRVPDGTVRVMLEGLQRVHILSFAQETPSYRVVAEALGTKEKRGIEIEALMRSATSQFEQIVSTGRNIPPEAVVNAMNCDEPGRLADTITPYLHQLRVESKQEILETLDVRRRLEKLSTFLKREWEILEIQKHIRTRVEKEMGDTQREMILREQLRAIQQELGERDERGIEIEEFREKVRAAKLPEAAAERANKEIDRLEKMPYAAPEGVVIRTYLDWLTSLPWSTATEDRTNIDEAGAVLDEDHYGLRKAKDRILEFLAVRGLVGSSMKGPILCFVGPPGVGKTSIGRSIARALGRKFVRISLGGVRDEAEIRGHRRTYIGALPGRIIQGVKQAGSNNPVFMLDEIDKLGMDFRGDPSSALLEALDPEQNGEFSDHYLEVPLNLRNVMFITTANLLDPIPAALRDRMEVISFAGYTEQEKLAIAQQFLIPKQRSEHGLAPDQLTLSEDALLALIREYTREAGVRNLEREIASICRKVARAVAGGRLEPANIDAAGVPEYLGKPRFRYGTMEDTDEVATATGLVYTEFGGDIVTVEVSVMRGAEGRLVLTGQLGDVMKESAQAALTYVRSRAKELCLDDDFYKQLEVHIHVPAGGVPKDGPSAGVTMATALASALTRRPVRKDVAMTGEITLRGRVLPVGGVKEKVLAAHRAGIRTVIMPDENLRDLDELPENVRAEMHFERVSHADRVLELALVTAAPEPKRRRRA
ncbi:MAG TPA: endopeptidase La [Chthonomonadales bacterium]|nr:endopeptidase La [Chthonomonadales bacterium]